jgi:hypothetical protein
MTDQREQTPRTFSTFLVLSVLICFMSWGTELFFLICQLVIGKLPGDSAAAHAALITVAVSSSIFVRASGSKQLAAVAHLRGKLQLTRGQSVVVTVFIVSYSVFLTWAIGGFESR